MNRAPRIIDLALIPPRRLRRPFRVPGEAIAVAVFLILDAAFVAMMDAISHALGF